MQPELFERIACEVAKHVPPIRVAVLYHGGEPLLNRNFSHMVRRLKELPIPFVKTVSNGMFLSAPNIAAVLESGLDAIEFSLDGTSERENNSIRRRSNFDRVVKGIRNLDERRRACGSALKIFVSTTQFIDIDRPDVDASAPVPRYLQDALEGIEVEFKATRAKLWPSEQPASNYDILHDDRVASTRPTCSLLEDTMTIRADGTVVACCYDLTTISNLGNIADRSLADLWSSTDFHRFRADFEAGDFPPLCKSCVVVTGDKYLLHQRVPGPQRVYSLSELSQRAESAQTFIVQRRGALGH